MVQDSSEARLPCRYCGEPILATAKKCKECGTWLNWRGLLNWSVPILSIVLAIISLSYTIGREIYDEIYSLPHVQILSTIGKRDFRTEDAFGFYSVELSIRVANSEDTIVILKPIAKCTATTTEGATGRFSARAKGEPPDQPIVVEQRGSLAMDFRTEEDFRILAAQTFSDLQSITCSFSYMFRGKEYPLVAKASV